MYCKRNAFCLLLMTFSLATGLHLFDKMVDYSGTDDESKRNIGRIDVVYPLIETLNSGIKRVTFRALDQDIELRLEPAGDVIADDFTIVDGENGEIDNSVDVKRLKRKLYKNSKMGSALYIDEDGPLIIKGNINFNLRIEPDTSKEASKNETIPHRVIEEIKDENFPSDTKIDPSASTTSLKCAESLSDDEYIRIVYLFVVDSYLTWRYNYELENIESYLSREMKDVQEEFDLMELGIKVAISGIIKIPEEYQAELFPFLPKYTPKTLVEIADTEDFLTKFAEFYSNSTNELVMNADIVVFLTGRFLRVWRKGVERKGGIENVFYVNGLSYFNTICNNRYKFAVVGYRINSIRAALFDHTLHILGAHRDHHDDNCPYIRISLHGVSYYADFSECDKKALEDMIKKRKHCIIESYSEKSNNISIVY